MKVLYGIQLTGNGHLTRSIELINQLKKNSIDVDIIVSGDNSSIEIPFDIKWRFKGISIYYNREGEVDWWKTIKNMKLIKFFRDTNIDVSGYDLVISDYEPISCWAARKHKVNCVGISNQYSLFYKKDLSTKYKMLNHFSKFFTPCDYYLGLDYVPTHKNIFQPIISDKFLNVKSVNKNFILVYLPSYKLTNLLDVVVDFKNIQWIIYSDEIQKEMKVKNITIRKINREKFQNDLINCDGVITASGFSTTSEALILQKRLWSIPLKFHTEQKLNSKSLEEIGVFTGSFGKGNVYKWIIDYKKINYKWSNPNNEIVNFIINFNKK
jgi:uncharacterized protein (TIGR00661 family)